MISYTGIEISCMTSYMTSHMISCVMWFYPFFDIPYAIYCYCDIMYDITYDIMCDMVLPIL